MNKHVARQPVLEHVLIEGEHTILRPVNAGDAKAGFEMIHDRREVLDWLVWQGPETIEELRNAYSRWITPGETGYNYHLAVTERASGDFCGTIGLRYVDHRLTCIGRQYYQLTYRILRQNAGLQKTALDTYNDGERVGDSTFNQAVELLLQARE